MQKKCNQCNTISREEALRICVHEECPNKVDPEVKQVYIELTQEDLDNSPELVSQGYKVGDKLFADNAGNTHVLGAPEPFLPPGGFITENPALIATEANLPEEGDPGDEQPIENRSIIGKIADFITGQ